jgi:tRNA(Arg) A34 adenosine deaminase TadA
MMIWERLSPPWRAAVEEAWAAYCNGSLPHGAVITNADGQIVARGRNRINEKAVDGMVLHGHRLAHAELNALIQTDWSKVVKETCVLYSTIEPCPMCVGAVRMAHAREIRYAARDNTSGGSTLIDKTPFFKSGQLHILGSEDAELETVLLAMLIEAALGVPYPGKVAWVAELSVGLPVAAKLGQQLYDSQLLRQWKEEGRDAPFVVDQLAEQASKIASELS